MIHNSNLFLKDPYILHAGEIVKWDLLINDIMTNAHSKVWLKEAGMLQLGARMYA